MATITTDQLTMAKRWLNITWSDTDTDAKVTEYVEDAKAWMDHQLGIELNYFSSGTHRILFKNYLLYLWNDCANEFEQAYAREINACRRQIHAGT